MEELYLIWQPSSQNGDESDLPDRLSGSVDVLRFLTATLEKCIPNALDMLYAIPESMDIGLGYHQSVQGAFIALCKALHAFLLCLRNDFMQAASHHATQQSAEFIAHGDGCILSPWAMSNHQRACHQLKAHFKTLSQSAQDLKQFATIWGQQVALNQLLILPSIQQQVY